MAIKKRFAKIRASFAAFAFNGGRHQKWKCLYL